MQKDFDFDVFMETSAKTGFNAQELLVEAGKILFAEYNKDSNTYIVKNIYPQKYENETGSRLEIDSESENKASSNSSNIIDSR